MLSVENTTPPDPPCPCEISQLRSSSDEKKASDKLALQEVDLLEPGLDDDKNPLPKFSIRDYVFNARSKDIQTNWPFSQKNLDLCLKHGVKDLLPPFQPHDSVRNQSFKKISCTAESSLLDQENISSRDGGEPSRPSNPTTSDDVGCAQKPSTGYIDTNSRSSEFGGENEFPSTTSTFSHSHSEAYIDSESPAGKPEAVEVPLVAYPDQKTESTIQHPVKKGRLIVKLGKVTDHHPSLSELNTSTSNNLVVSETMASKVCPVCKTFSSSSNTTLNAHIDQCLSGESTVKWGLNSKKIKHRIKARKTRLMVDIYATALHCTLEELDRRNGTNWATGNSGLPAQETRIMYPDDQEEEREQRVSSVNVEVNTGKEGAVYIDANGTKLRILSKFNDVPLVSRTVEGPGRRKFLKGGKGNKFLAIKKKKHHVKKHHKFQKLASQGKRFCSSKLSHSSEVHGCQKSKSSMEGSRLREERVMRRQNGQAQIKFRGDGTIRQWVCSKRTNLVKKTLDKDEYKDLTTESDQSSLGDSYSNRSYVPMTPHSFENPITYPEGSNRKENVSHELQVHKYRKQMPLQERVGLLSLGSQGGGNGKRSLVLPKQSRRQLTKYGTARGGCEDPPNYTENYVSNPKKKTMEIHAGPVKNSDISVSMSTPSGSYHACFSKVKRFSSLSKNLLPVSGASPLSRSSFKRKVSALNNSRVNCMSESSEAASIWAPEEDGHHDPIQIQAENQSVADGITEKMSVDRTSRLKIKQKRGAATISRKEEAMILTNPRSAHQYHDRDVEEKLDSTVRVDCSSPDAYDDLESARVEDQTHVEENVNEPATGMAVGGSFMSLKKSLDHELHKLANPSDAKSELLHLCEAYKGPLLGAEAPTCPSEPGLGDEQMMFCADEVGNDMVVQSADVGTNVSKDAQENYLLEVDSIPIPGPPGSFLPSPGSMGSEDLQGNSSLTSSRVQYSEDHPDLVDSSDSPISATSTISNSGVRRSHSRSSDKLSQGHHALQDETRSGFSGAIVDFTVDNSSPVPQWAKVGAERINIDELKVNAIFPEKGPSSFRNYQSCCCSRKEGASPGIAFNYQDSQLLRRRALASVSLPAIGKKMSCEASKMSGSLNSTPEVFSMSNYPSSGPEKVLLPAMKSPAGNIPIKYAVDSDLKIPIRGESDAASPSASNPVLRLMGKNLMVVNKEEDASSQHRSTQLNDMNDHPNPQLITVCGVSPSNVQNKDNRTFHDGVSQGPNIFGQNQHNRMLEHSDCRLSSSSRCHIDIQTPQTYPAATVAFPSESVGGGFMAPLVIHEHKGGCSLPIEQNRPKNRLNTPLSWNTGRMATTSSIHCRNEDFSSNPVKEIIIIDDSPDSEANSATAVTFSEGIKRSRVCSSSVSVPMGSECKSRDLNPFYGYPVVQGLSSHSGPSPVVQNTSFQMSTAKGLNASPPVQWNCTPSGGVSILPPSTLTAPSSSSSHLRSTLYYSPSFS